MKAIPWQRGEVQELDSPCMPLSWPSDALFFTLLSAVLRSKNWSCLHSFPCGALTVLVFGRKRKRRRKRKRKRRKLVEKKLQAIPCSEADALNRITSSKSKKQMKCFPCDEYCSPAHCTNWWLILIDDYLMFRLPMNPHLFQICYEFSQALLQKLFIAYRVQVLRLSKRNRRDMPRLQWSCWGQCRRLCCGTCWPWSLMQSCALANSRKSLKTCSQSIPKLQNVTNMLQRDVL